MKITNGVYWVGSNRQNHVTHHNPYLLVDQKIGVLFDASIFEDSLDMIEQIRAIIPLEQLHYVVLQQTFPGCYSSLENLAAAGAKFTLVTHWRTYQVMLQAEASFPVYLVNEHNYEMILPSKRRLDFIPAAYLSDPGAFMTYDMKSKTLFSNVLFSSFTPQWTLFAGEDNMERMMAYHEHVISSNRIMLPVLDAVKKLEIQVVAPHYGSIINQPIRPYLEALQNLETGSYLYRIKHNLSEVGGYSYVIGQLIRRLCAIYGTAPTLQVIHDLPIEIDESSLVVTDLKGIGETIWDQIFHHIYDKKGFDWIMMVKPLALKLSYEYTIPIPSLFYESTVKGEIYKNERRLKEVQQEALLKLTQADLILSPLSGVYSATFFSAYLTHLLPEPDSQFLFISIDNLPEPCDNHPCEQVLRSVIHRIKENGDLGMNLFSLGPKEIVAHLYDQSMEKAKVIADLIRNDVAHSPSFLDRVTVSIAVLGLEELRNQHHETIEQAFEHLARQKMSLAKSLGNNIVIAEPIIRASNQTVLLGDTDYVSLDVLKTKLIELKYHVIIAKDGEELLRLAQQYDPDYIITEIMLPKQDAYRVRQELLEHSETKHIEMILMSYLKDESNVLRALRLGITYYLQKPFLLTEMLGIIEHLRQGGKE